MSTGCGKRKLRGLYQDLLFPTTRATVTRESRSPMADTRNRATDALLLQGTNGPESVYPFWGTFKSIREIAREVSQENRGVLRWLSVLLLATAAAAVAFSVVGSPLPPWWQIAALIAVGGIAGVSPSASRPKWRCRSRSSPSFSRQSRLVLTPHSWWRSVQVSRTSAGRSSVGPFTHP